MRGTPCVRREDMIKLLGAFGTSKSVKTLKKYASDKSTVLAKAASEALEEIEGIRRSR